MKIKRRPWRTKIITDTDGLDTILPSRRGPYRLTANNAVDRVYEWTPKPLNNSNRANMVKQEIEDAFNWNLGNHPYWANEEDEFVNDYSWLYRDLFKLEWLEGPADRHNVVVNQYCCLTLVQYHNGILHAYSRSTDMKNGLHSDKLVLEYLAEVINEKRPDCPVHTISWTLAIPHVYEKPGIARLLHKEDM